VLLTNEDSHLVGSFISSVQGKRNPQDQTTYTEHHRYYNAAAAAAADQIDRLLLGSSLLTFARHHTSWCLGSSV
jgi:hypothetical protein